MQMRFEVLIDTDKASPGEVEAALEENLRKLEIPNGDVLYLDSVQVNFKGCVE